MQEAFHEQIIDGTDEAEQGEHPPSPGIESLAERSTREGVEQGEQHTTPRRIGRLDGILKTYYQKSSSINTGTPG